MFSRSKRSFPVKVTTMDAEMTSIEISPDWTGRQLFDAICRIIGLREIWYFGLQFVNKNGITIWLQMEKLISEQGVPRNENGEMHFYFLVKFYPESVEDELIQDITRHLFFLQIKQSIHNEELYCRPEAAVLLASYAVQALHGDADDSIEIQMDKLIPAAVMNRYHMSQEMWQEKLRQWWQNNNGLSIEDAETEYIRIAEDLDMYGIQYYPIYNQKDTNLLLGVSAHGIGIYETHNRMSPRPFFPWSEIKNISFKNKQFNICIIDNSKIKFRAQEMSINMSILDLCIGSHNLYLRRRQPDLIEVQQMKIQAKELRQRRVAEQAKLQKEREMRIQAETERDKYKIDVAYLTEQLAAMQESIRNEEEARRLHAETPTQEEINRSEAEQEMQRNRAPNYNGSYGCEDSAFSNTVRRSYSNIPFVHSQSQDANNSPDLVESPIAKVEEHFVLLDNGYPNSQIVTSGRNSAESSRVVSSSPTLVDRLNSNPMEHTAKHMNNNVNMSEDSQQNPENTEKIFGNRYFDKELLEIVNELHRAKHENEERSKELRNSLTQFREEIEKLKKEDVESEHEKIQAENIASGFDKRSRLRRSCAGPPKQRVEAFDGI